MLHQIYLNIKQSINICLMSKIAKFFKNISKYLINKEQKFKANIKQENIM